MDIRLALMTGIDIPVPSLQTVIHQPTIKEISYIGEEGFYIAAQYLCLNKKMFIKDESLLETITNFQVLMKVLEQLQQENPMIREYVIALLTLIFPGYKVIFMPQSIILNNMDTKENLLIDDNNFDEIQKLLNQIFCVNSGAMGENTNFNPQGKKAQEIADKIMRGRQRLAAEQGDQKSSVLARYLSILTIGTNTMPIESCWNLTLYQLYDLVERYTLFVNWDIDVRTRLAGGKPDSKPDNWMKDIH